MISIKEMITKMKENVICDFPDDYAVSDNLLHGFTEGDARIGIKGFSSLLIQIYDALLHDTDNSITEEEATVNSLGLTNIYTGIKNSLSLLYSFGVCGKLSDNNDSLLIDGGNQDKQYDIFTQPGGLWLRVCNDATAAALIGSDNSEPFNPWKFGAYMYFAKDRILQSAAEENGYEQNPDVHLEIEYHCDAEYDTPPHTNYAYIPIIEK